MKILSALALLFGWGLVQQASAATVSVAVAANFTATANQLAHAFKAETGDNLALSFGATGALYTQITQGAPFEILLSADDTRTKTAIREGFGIAGTDFTYALGALVLYSPKLDVSVGASSLDLQFQKLAIADLKAAPYGAAAIETLMTLGKLDALTPKFVTGENITQTLQFVETGNAELGFVAASQVMGKAHQWAVPPEMHKPIRQDAVLLRPGEGDPAATAFLKFLQSPAAISIIEAAGYTVPKP